MSNIKNQSQIWTLVVGDAARQISIMLGANNQLSMCVATQRCPSILVPVVLIVGLTAHIN